jgi:hypothetical protein
MNDEDDLSDEGTLDLVLSLPPPVSPVGDGYMPLFCAAHWIATKGGGLSIDPLDTGIWRSAFGDLLDAIASERVRVTGIADRQRAPVPAYLFAGIRVAYPMVMTPLDLLFSHELVLMSRQYLDEEDWLEGDGDALVDRWSTHWRRLMVEKGDILSHWPFNDEAEQRTGLPGRPPLSKHLIAEELLRRASTGNLASTLAKEADELRQWLCAQYPRHVPPGVRTIENNIRDAYKRLRPTK